MQIAGYSIREKIHAGNSFTLFRAYKLNTPISCIIKVLEKKAANSFQMLDELKQEYLFLSQVECDHVIKALDWVEDKEYAALVLEEIEGISLKKYLKNSLFLNEQFIHCAIRICTGLTSIHSQNIIHKDINPSNIIYNEQTGALKIIDFNISSKFDMRVSYLGNPEKLKGTLLYLSPEQSGRMNHRVDHRTDLYSLGVTFYEMLSGQVPFPFQSPMEIVYAHLARDPEPLHLLNQEVPKILSRVVMKLMTKDPGKRYQSALGLKYDLEQIKRLAQNKFKEADTFSIGQKDFSGKLQIPERLYGRQDEIETLLAAYHRVSSGTTEMILVTGYSGTGKTALVHQMHKTITKNHGYFISGRFDRLQRAIPYVAFSQALNQFCQLLLTERQEILARWKKSILESVGTLGRVLTDVFPLLESVIGVQPEVPAVGGEEAKKRFHYVFQHFLQKVSSKQHPLVLFIDNMQWADPDSMSLLQVVMEDRQNHHMLVIGAFRDNQVTDQLSATIQDIRETGVPVYSINVKNLLLNHVCHWLKDTLNIADPPEYDSSRESCSPFPHITEFAGLIYKKTQGNAFFTIQFLENLYRENLLYFDFKLSQWQWDIEAIENQNITDNVVELLVRRIKTLSTEVQEVLKLAACIGNTFDLRTLSMVSGKARETYKEPLETGQSQHLVFPSGGNSFKFAHDRIHQAAYRMVSEDERIPLHLKIGRLLLKRFMNSEIPRDEEQSIFKIVNHLNTGIQLIEDKEEKLKLIRLNLEAGQNAKASAAYKQGSHYIHRAILLLPKDCWQSNYTLTLAIFNEAIQTSYLCSNFPEMESYVEEVLDSATNMVDKSIAYEYRLMSFMGQNKPHLVVDMLLEIFNKMGISIPRNPGKWRITYTLLKYQAISRFMGAEKLKKLPLMTDLEKLFLFKLFSKGAAGFIFSAVQLFPVVISKLFGVSLKYGMAPETPYLFSLFGNIRVRTGNIPGAYQMGRLAMQLKDNIDCDERNRGKVITTGCLFTLGWKIHFKEVGKLLMEAYHYSLNAGDFENMGYSLSIYIQLISCTDVPIKTFNDKAGAARQSLEQLKQPLMEATLEIMIPVGLNLSGVNSKPELLDINLEHITRDSQAASVKLLTKIAAMKQLILAFLFEDYQHLPRYIEIVEKQWKNLKIPFMFEQSDYQFYVPLAYLQLCDNATTADLEIYLERVKHCLKKLKQWAQFGPVNFLHKYYLVLAEFYRVNNQPEQQAEYYDKAIEKAYENEYMNEAAIANELAARCYKNQKRHKLAALYFTEARECYLKWGATAKVKHLEKNYPRYIRGSAYITNSTSSSSFASGEFLDMESILKATQTLSSEVQLKGLLEKMMQILVENAGAQRCVLIENNDHRLVVQAEGTSQGVSSVLQQLPVAESANLPISIINLCARSGKILVFDNASKDTNYATDQYIQRYGIKSIVCFPITSKGKLAALIYLENNLIEGAFTPTRMEVLNILSSQMAISLENTHLYQNLEKKVKRRTAELEKQHKRLEISHQKINDSVSYASRIQEAVLPSRQMLVNIFPQHFLLYRPCSLVSGDFYWVKKIDNRIIVAAADCTGHGVPGALVSMLGITFLNDVVSSLAASERLPLDKNSSLTGSNVLEQLRTKLKTAMKQDNKRGGQKEGMDIALCIIDPVNRELQFAGAHNPLYLIRQGELIEIKADRIPIGIARKERPFTNNNISFLRGDMIYLFSDGYIDQNSDKGKARYTKKRFKKLLIEIHRLPMSKQKEMLISRFARWKGTVPQRDDVLVMGIRL